VLRRLYDEPLALEEKARAHYNACAQCQARLAEIADDARQAAALLSAPGATVDAQAALRRLQSRPLPTPQRLRLPVAQRLGWRKPAVAGLVAAALVGTLAFTPLAQTVQKAFEPTKVSTVDIQKGDLQGLEAFSGWGDVKQGGNTSLSEAGSAQEAAQQSGLPELQVRSGLPAQVAALPVSYGTVGQLNGTVVFTDKAPSELHGTTMAVQAGPGQAVVYGDVQRAMTGAKQAQSPEQAASAAGPMVAVIEMRSPKVTSTGKSVKEIKSVLLKQKGLSPNMRTLISNFDNPEGNLPLPIPVDYATSTPTKLDNGRAATLVGDNTKLGAGIIWVNSKTHMSYAVVGVGVTQADVTAIANGVAGH
jgi:hypothetical protein